eukprot:6450596-Ditylum_brightwellii.AAC.1
MSVKAKGSAKGKLPVKDKRKTCILCQQFGGNPNHHTAKDCYRHKVISNNKSQTSRKCPTGDPMNVE